MHGPHLTVHGKARLCPPYRLKDNLEVAEPRNDLLDDTARDRRVLAMGPRNECVKTPPEKRGP